MRARLYAFMSPITALTAGVALSGEPIGWAEVGRAFVAARSGCGRVGATAGAKTGLIDYRTMSPSVAMPHRVAGNLALDLANTISWRGTRREVDHLADAVGLAAWAQASGLIDDAGFVTAGDLAEVRALRTAVAAAGTAIAAAGEPDAAAQATIRDLAARTLASASLQGVPARIVFAPNDRIIGPLAWAALDLLRGNELARLKQCPPDDCRWLFIDRTKNGSRRWCDMASCGNRAKARRWR